MADLTLPDLEANRALFRGLDAVVHLGYIHPPASQGSRSVESYRVERVNVDLAFNVFPLSLEEGVGKMRAALAARRDPDLAIAGRTSATAITGVEDAIRRAKAYEAAGVDAMFLVGIKTKEQLEAAAEQLRIPIILGGGAILGDRAYLASKGVRVSLQGHQPFQAAVRAIHDTLKALRDGTAPADLKNLASNELMAKVTRSADYAGWTRDFLGGVGKG